MSVGLFKYDGDINDKDHKLIMSENIASERKYIQYLAPAVKELSIKYFKDGSEIRKPDLDEVLVEIESLIRWVNDYAEGVDKEYLLERLENMKVVIPEALKTDDDVLYIF